MRKFLFLPLFLGTFFLSIALSNPVQAATFNNQSCVTSDVCSADKISGSAHHVVWDENVTCGGDSAKSVNNFVNAGRQAMCDGGIAGAFKCNPMGSQEANKLTNVAFAAGYYWCQTKNIAGIGDLLKDYKGAQNDGGKHLLDLVNNPKIYKPGEYRPYCEYQLWGDIDTANPPRSGWILDSLFKRYASQQQETVKNLSAQDFVQQAINELGDTYGCIPDGSRDIEKLFSWLYNKLADANSKNTKFCTPTNGGNMDGCHISDFPEAKAIFDDPSKTPDPQWTAINSPAGDPCVKNAVQGDTTVNNHEGEIGYQCKSSATNVVDPCDDINATQKDIYCIDILWGQICLDQLFGNIQKGVSYGAKLPGDASDKLLGSCTAGKQHFVQASYDQWNPRPSDIPADAAVGDCYCTAGTDEGLSTAMCDKYVASEKGLSFEKANKDPDVVACRNCFNSDGGGYWSAIGCIHLGSFQDFITKNLFGWGIGLAGTMAFFCIIYSAIQLQLSGGNPEKIKKTQEVLTSCIMGLMLIIFSIFILRVVGVDILGLPGLK